MAPPSPRRPGFSRRAQYGIFASYLIALIGLAGAFLLVLTARFDPQGHSALQSAAADLTQPVSNAGRSLVSSFNDGWSNIVAYVNAASTNQALTKELKDARRQLVQAKLDRQENARLKALLGIKEKSASPVTSARIVGSTGASTRRYATLTAGTSAGVTTGQPVIGPDGLVGRIVATGRTSARVLLIIDGGNVTPVKRAADGAAALATGTGDGRLVIRPLANTVILKAGDIFLTSGSGGIYRPGIPVAQVIKSGREGASARPMADPTRLDFVLVEQIFQAPPPPAPSAIPGQEDG